MTVSVNSELDTFRRAWRRPRPKACYLLLKSGRILRLILTVSLVLRPWTLWSIEVHRWQTHDFAFKSSTPHQNPFQVEFSAIVNGPGGIQIDQLGFYDGDGTWKIRLGPNVLGQWSIRTISSDPELDGKTVQNIVCVKQRNPRVHGGLLVDSEHPHHFIREDGTRFFYSGFECDWLWAVDLATCDPALPQTTMLLDKLATYEFNVVFMNIYAHTGFGLPGQQPNFGPPAKYAWGGSNDQPDHSVFNLSFWQHYDRVIQAMWDRGLDAHIMLKVYNKHVNWPRKGSPEDDRYFKYIMARYAPFCNVHWDFAKESNNEKDLAYKLGRFQLIRQSDPYRRLLTTHTDHSHYKNYFGVLDYRTDQNQTNLYRTALRHRTQEQWPVVNSEYGYEQGGGGPEDKTFSDANDGLTILKRAWEVNMAGAYATYYYTYTSWDVIRVNDTPAGYGYHQHMADFFKRVGLWQMKPDDSLVDAGHCLVNPGVEYVVYQPEPRDFTLKIASASRDLISSWFNPLTGEWIESPRLQNGECRLTPPALWTNGPVVLHVGKPPKEKRTVRNTFARPLPMKTGANP